MHSFFLRFIFLNFLFIFFVSLELSASKNEWLKFTDNDSRGGWISGDMEVTIPDDLSWTVPKAMSIDQIKEMIDDFVLSSKKLMLAGFNGVEISAGVFSICDETKLSRGLPK